MTFTRQEDGTLLWQLPKNGTHQAVSSNTFHLYGLPFTVALIDILSEIRDLCSRFRVEVTGFAMLRHVKDQTTKRGVEVKELQPTGHAYVRITDGHPFALMQIITLSKDSMPRAGMMPQIDKLLTEQLWLTVR